MLTLQEHLDSPQLLVRSVFLKVLVFSLVLFFVLLVFVSCLVYPMLPVSLDCLFLIAPSVFFNIYLMKGAMDEWLTC